MKVSNKRENCRNDANEDRSSLRKQHDESVFAKPINVNY